MRKIKKLSLLLAAMMACGTMAFATGCSDTSDSSTPNSESSKIETPEDSSTPEATKYMVKFVNEDGTVLQEGEVEEGETPAYTGETPVKDATVDKTYTFSGWDKTIVSVTEDVVYI